MNYKNLGTSDLVISEIGFGCMSLKGGSAENERLILKAIDNGINFFDTADVYEKGQNEKLVGKALRQIRTKVILATKVGNQWREDDSGFDWNPSKQYILSAAEASLKRLQTDCIDLYQLHGGTIEDNIDETIEAFELLKHQGKIRHYGISSIRPNVISEYVKRSNMVSVMMQYSLLDRRPEEMAFPLLKQHNIGVLVRGAVAGGILVDKPAGPYLKYTQAQVSDAAHAVELLSGQIRTSAQTAIQFALHHPAVTTAVVGIRTATQLEEAAGCLSAPLLTENEYDLLSQSVKLNYYDQHRTLS